MKRSARIEANKAHIKHTQKETESNVSGYWSEMIAMLASEQENMAYENNIEGKVGNYNRMTSVREYKRN